MCICTCVYIYICIYTYHFSLQGFPGPKAFPRTDDGTPTHYIPGQPLVPGRATTAIISEYY